MTTPPKRPDLSFITGADMSTPQKNYDWWKRTTIEQKKIVCKAKENESIKALITMAEMLFDQTASNPEGLAHQYAAKTLKEIADGI